MSITPSHTETGSGFLRKPEKLRAGSARRAIFTSTLAVFLFAPSAYANWLLQPSIALESQHSSNFQLFTSDGAEDSLIANTVIAGLGVRRRGEDIQVDGRVELSYSTYSGARNLDDIDRQYADIRIRRRLERGSVGVAASVRRDNLLRFVNSFSDPESTFIDVGAELEQTLDDPNSDINFSTEQLQRTSSSFRVFGDYRLTERNRLRLSYNFIDRNINSPAALEELGVVTRSTNRHNVRFGFTREINERSRFSWDSQASRINTAQLDTVEIYESTLGWSSRISEQTRVSASIGINATNGASNDRSGLVTRVQFSHRVSWGTIEAQALRSFRPTVGGGVNEVDSLRLSYERQLAPSWSLSFEAFGNQRRRSTEVITDDTIRTVRLGPRLSWGFAREWAVSAGYQYRYIDRDQVFANGSGFDHAGILSINYKPSGAQL